LNGYEQEMRNLKIKIIVTGSIVIILTGVLIGLSYNFNTHFWFDTPFADPNYHVWHPHTNDSCDELQSKLDLFHPKGTNPVRFEIMEAMFLNDCEVIIR